MAAMVLTAHVERSIFPGLRRISIVQCPGAGALPALAAAPLAKPVEALIFEPPELGDGAQVAEGAEALGEAGLGGSAGAEAETMALSRHVGTNVLVGGMYGFFAHLFRPGLRKLSRRAGALAPVVQLGGEAGTIGIAYVLASLCKGAAGNLGAVVTKIPLLGANNAVGAALQMGIASYLGSKVGELIVPEAQEAAASRAAPSSGPGGDVPQVFVSYMCVMCNTKFEVGGNHSIAALSCGHACLCQVNEDGGSCVETYLRERHDCPLCRSYPVNVMHELRI